MKLRNNILLVGKRNYIYNSNQYDLSNYDSFIQAIRKTNNLLFQIQALAGVTVINVLFFVHLMMNQGGKIKMHDRNINSKVVKYRR